MTEKLKYKVGDKVLVEHKIIEVNKGEDHPYITVRDDTKLRCLWSKNSLESVSVNLPPKPKVPQAVMDWYEKHKRSHWNVRDYFVHTPEEIDDWLSKDLQNEHAFVTLITYGPEAVEVEKEKKYKVTLKATGQLLKKYGDKYIFAVDGLFIDLTKQELIEAGFEGVFDNPMFEVEEVEK